MNTHTDIERYLADQMDASERSVFEQKLRDDSAVKAEFDAYIKMQGALDVLLEDDVKEVINKMDSGGNIRRLPRWAVSSIAASMVVLVVASLWLYNVRPADYPNEDSFIAMFDRTIYGSRSAGGLVSEEEVQLRVAYGHIERKNMDEAIEILESLKDVKDDDLRIEVNWFLALSYHRIGEVEKYEEIIAEIYDDLDEERQEKVK